MSTKRERTSFRKVSLDVLSKLHQVSLAKGGAFERTSKVARERTRNLSTLLQEARRRCIGFLQKECFAGMKGWFRWKPFQGLLHRGQGVPLKGPFLGYFSQGNLSKVNQIVHFSVFSLFCLSGSCLASPWKKFFFATLGPEWKVIPPLHPDFFPRSSTCHTSGCFDGLQNGSMNQEWG